jgi:hypothetical protein
MMRLLPLVLVAGCATRTPGRYAGAALTTVGAVGLGYVVSRDCPEAMHEQSSYPPVGVPDVRPLACGTGKLALGTLATMVLLTGVTTLIVNEATARGETRDEAAPAPRSATDPLDNPELRQLVINASAAARQRRCSDVYKLALRIEEIDAQFRREGLLTDPAIEMCLVPKIHSAAKP